nr:hypothetical protein [Tanacetum cinerariifolium]GEY09475.1 hypothetical protein [Tanacetum cinerariifolium]
ALGTNSIWNSIWRTEGKPGSSSEKTFGNSLTTVPSQMTHLVASITLDSARSCVIQGAFLTQGTVSSISIVLSWVYAFHQDKASLVRVRVANVTFFSSAQLLRENTDSIRSNQTLSWSSVPIEIVGIYVVAACASSDAVTLLTTNCLMAS